MKKLFTFLACAVCALSANAAGNYYANYVQLNVLPEGAGKVYVGQAEADENTEWKDNTAELQFVTQLGSYYLCASPSDGYQFAGFSQTTLDEDEEPIENYDIISDANPTSYMGKSSEYSAGTESEANSLMPLIPNFVYYALFTHVKAGYLEQMNALGKVSVDKVCNEIGDEITLTATPDTEFDPSAKFDYWVKESTGEKIYENPLKVTVTGKETYKVHFTADKALTLHFSEDGEYKLWYTESSLSGHCFPDNVWNSTITLVDKNYVDENDDTKSNTTGVTYTTVEQQSHYMWHNKTACLLWGKGDATVILTGKTDDPEDEAETKDVCYAQEDLEVSELPVAYKYYSIDIPNQVFRLISDDATITKGSFYIQFDATAFSDEEYPELLYWSAEAAVADGIDAVKVNEAVKNGKVYNLGGQQVKSAGKGIYIMDGKKFIKK